METIIKSQTQTVTIGPKEPVCMIGERINPTGRKKMAAAIEEGDLELLQQEAKKQVEAGAQVLDVNVGVSGIDEPKMLSEAVSAITEVVEVPLCIDSASPKALAAGLSVYKGKALVNSVNGETEKLGAVLPLVKQHGAAVIGLTMDDNGIPKGADERFAIAARIVEQADKLGIPKEDVVIDSLAMAVSTDDQAALETLRCMARIRDELGLNQTLGVSNISFGMPERVPCNAVFITMAILHGLTCPIVDPTVWAMRRTIMLADLLLGKDEFCMRYITAFREQAEA